MRIIGQAADACWKCLPTLPSFEVLQPLHSAIRVRPPRLPPLWRGSLHALVALLTQFGEVKFATVPLFVVGVTRYPTSSPVLASTPLIVTV